MNRMLPTGGHTSIIDLLSIRQMLYSLAGIGRGGWSGEEGLRSDHVTDRTFV